MSAVAFEQKHSGDEQEHDDKDVVQDRRQGIYVLAVSGAKHVANADNTNTYFKWYPREARGVCLSRAGLNVSPACSI